MMTILQVERLAKTLNVWATGPMIRLAAKSGTIPGCRKVGQRWQIPAEAARKWLKN